MWKSRSPSTFGFDFPSQAKSSRSIGITVQSLPNPYYVCLVWIIITGSFYILHSFFPSPLSPSFNFFLFSIWCTVRVCCQVSVHTSLINAPVQAHLVKEYIKPRVFLYPPHLPFGAFKAIHSTVTAGAREAEPITSAPLS